MEKKVQLRKIFGILFLLAGCLFFIGWLFLFDYSDFSWSNNSGAYVGIISSMLIVAGLVVNGKFFETTKNHQSKIKNVNGNQISI